MQGLFCGLEDNIKNFIEEVTCFAEGPLHFRYLGIPLTSKKLNNNQCISLVDKIGARIRHWSAHFLSYSGRVQLIKSVIFGTKNY